MDPRLAEVARSIPGPNPVEMKNHLDKSICRGAGGGHRWIDLKEEERINNLRVRQAREAGADTIECEGGHICHLKFWLCELIHPCQNFK